MQRFRGELEGCRILGFIDVVVFRDTGFRSLIFRSGAFVTGTCS